MDKSLTKEESYAERRQLFKDIWETAMTISEKEDIMNKPKVIKTLRLDQVDRCAIGNKKKQRIKNLRSVCNKILDFCDRQDADDLFYEQMATDSQETPQQHKPDPKPRKPKPHLGRKKIKATKSFICSPLNEILDPRATNSDRKKEDLVRSFKVSRNTSPMKRTALKRSIYLSGKALKPKTSPKSIRPPVIRSAQPQNEGKAVMRRKTVRKKRSKRKKSSDTVTQPGQPGVINWPDV